MQIKTAICQLTVKPRERMVLPSYKGATLRGGFGFAFRHSSCALRRNDCNGCLLKGSCAYSYIFETPPPSDTTIMRKYPAAPHPFVIEPPSDGKRQYGPGDMFSFGLVLIGKAIDYMPYFIQSFTTLGEIGLGKGKTRFDILHVTGGGTTVYDPQRKQVLPARIKTLTFESTGVDRKGEKQNIALTFETPTRIKYSGRLIIDLEFHILLRNILRRIALLGYFHCDIKPGTWDFGGLIRRATEVRTTRHALRWHDWQRYSARQEAKMKLGGFVGEIEFEGDLSPFMDILKAGEILHVGKGATFGLGKYRLEQYC